ncbi:acriflavine resistance protein B [Niastella vici]|uniref:Acriflavine resistance protein B n=1 Tax=Niastella vici TaxID=1703345 RepID=A0A1V9FPE2_9BACT|nr:CusA/CzcA family heavy metal efflux RND transporter [Niastella vici]OQP60200.1 acriflavine resistance protein B [Niastella vici]
MFDKIIQFSINNKLAIGILTLALIVWGIVSLSRLPIDAVPDITNNQVQIITQAASLGAQEVEQFITAPIELAMSNIPDVVEKRSISRSGISVITLVFKDNVDVYWARQQVGERLKEAERVIPKGMGDPSLAPITTGLGEIYQYVLHTKPGYEKKYSAMDLRTMQDWIVRTQLAGTEGVAEVSGWGGYVKQYEVAVDNERLNAQNISIKEIFEALENNNENTGGSYIEQRNNSYFIRGAGQVKTLGDIEKIVVKSVNGIPILIRDIAKVQWGSATRYGAVTRNGEGEVVAGITLMLKGENFSRVIRNVKERMKQIQKSLPEGVVIEPFIDRTELVGRTISTVKRNMIEGGLIVIFVLILLLGNLRAGLLVASVIPLSMLFAFSMMQLFGVSGNLMSLGAIDFGLIVDGAVIIVESVVHRISQSKHHHTGIPRLTKPQMDKEVFESASRLMRSAAFGQIIILIVYLPLLSLVGIEGKMFRPMAQTVAFAILGAFIFSLTYVPMMSALFLSKKTTHKKNISDRIMSFIHRLYEPALKGVLRWKLATVIIALALFVMSLFIFNRLGGEFIPTLEEGDLTVEISMMQGASLSQAVESFTKAEKILKTKFPEVKQVVTRIGSAEIPTDPMPMERGDMMVAMQPKEEWKSAKTREEMMEKMQEALSVLPGVNVEITQPMQMRFNELMTGIRQDVAVKIYGDDLDILAQQANKVAKLISAVNGVSEPYVEKVTGLPQIVVEYNRDKMAQYGLSISDVNRVLRTAFAGEVAGVVFEGEKRFDMVVRLQRDLRENIINIESLFIPLSSGNKVPLNQVANITFKEAPAQVSREDGKRRIYVGFNVRGRDVERTVSDIQNIMNDQLKLPAGYYITYGGQFQNLKEAKQRLSIAVPVALALILFLLFITFRSAKQMLLIFTAVPLSAIGGVLALWLRGMPFSISAGVGFIALFGVAVLNGIVLIGYFNQLKQEGVTDIYQRVLEGTKVRLRPVIMTASVASLGFLPMALSTSAGAEVQKPLATVVIGGLLTATLLTLLVLPCLYILFSRIKKDKKMSLHPVSVILVIAFCFSIFYPTSAIAQSKPMNLDSLVAIAKRQNLRLKTASLEVQQNKVLQKTAFDPGKTNLAITQDPTSGGNIDNAIGFTQNFAWPGYYSKQREMLSQQTVLAHKLRDLTEAEMIREIKLAYYNYIYGLEKIRLLNYQDSIYRNFSEKAAVRFKTGETSKLEKLTADNKYQEVLLMKKGALADLQVYELVIQQLLNISEPVQIADTTTLAVLELNVSQDTTTLYKHPLLDYYRQQVQVKSSTVRWEKAKMLPELTVGYSHQLVISGFNPAKIHREYFPGTRIAGFQLGVGVPLFNGANKARINASKIGVSIAETQLQNSSRELQTEYLTWIQEYQKYQQSIQYYQSIGLKQTDEQIRVAQIAYSKGEIGYIEFIQSIGFSIQSKLQYLSALNQYNQTIIQLNYLQGGN